MTRCSQSAITGLSIRMNIHFLSMFWVGQPIICFISHRTAHHCLKPPSGNVLGIYLHLSSPPATHYISLISKYFNIWLLIFPFNTKWIYTALHVGLKVNLIRWVQNNDVCIMLRRVVDETLHPSCSMSTVQACGDIALIWGCSMWKVTLNRVHFYLKCFSCLWGETWYLQFDNSCKLHGGPRFKSWPGPFCVEFCDLCRPVMDWRPVQRVPRLSPNDSWDRLQPLIGLSGYRKWMNGMTF